MNQNMNDVSHIDVTTLPEFGGRKILKVMNISISEDQDPTYKCIMDDGSKADVPVDFINNSQE